MSASCDLNNYFCPNGRELEALFKTSDIRYLVYRERISDLVPSGTKTFDLVVKINRRAVGIFRDTWVGVAYWPSGPILRGVQAAQEGQELVFRNLSVQDGGEIVVGLGDELGVEVSVKPLGYQPPPVDKSNDVGVPGSGVGAGIGIGTILGLALALFLVSKSKG